MTWQEIAAERQLHRDNTIKKVEPAVPEVEDLPLNVTSIPSQVLSQEVITITESTMESLLSQLAMGKITSTSVTKAFLQRAGLAQSLTNCITELLPDRAIERATFLDDHLAKYGKPIGPLHGLPISVKEHVSMKGLDINAGFVAWVGQIAADDALILKLLWNAGAVFYARTTEPQCLMHLETSTNIYGVTVNPYHRNLTSGGSSGGEGALLGLRGSCLGIGTDIGGSIRSPAANNGLFGLRPTTYRLPLNGLAAPMLGEEQIIPVIGPLSTTLQGIQIFMKTLIDQKPWLYEPSLVPLQWKDTSKTSLLRKNSTNQRTLRIGILKDDGVVKPHPPILRGIETLLSKLKHHPNIQIVDFSPYKHAEAWKIISALYFPDGAQEEISLLEKSGEPLLPLTEWIIKENPHVRSNTLSETWKLTVEREAYKTEWTQHWNSINTSLPGPGGASIFNAAEMQEDMVDVILCPAGPGVAPRLGTARYWGYTSLWNLLDYPALVFPTGLVVGKEDGREEGYVPRNEEDRYNWGLYDPEKYKDAPISLQLVGRRYEDEKVIEACEMILEASQLLAKP